MPANALSIVHVLSHRKVRRGGAVQALLLARAQSEAGHRVLVIANAKKATSKKLHASFRPWQELGLDIRALRLGRVDDRYKLRRRIQRVGADVVHVHRNDALEAAYWATVGLPRVALVEQRGTTRALQTAMVRWIHRRLRPHRIIAVSAAVKDALVAEGIAADRIAVVFGSFDIERFDPATTSGDAVRAEFAGALGAKLVLQVGALTGKKGTDDFLQMAALVARQRPDVRFVLVGQGKKPAYYERLAAELGVAERVVFAGFRTDIPAVLAAADVVANCSTGREGLTGVLREAAAMARPIAATAVDGNPELIQDGVTGLLVPPRNPEAMAGAVMRLLDDPALGARLGAEARRFVEAHMHPRVRLERTVAVYADALAACGNALSCATSSTGC